MAVEKITRIGWKTVMLIRPGLTLTVNMANTVGFDTQIASATPTGYVFRHLEFVGAWPEQSWTNGCCVQVNNKSTDGYTEVILLPLSTQKYTVRAVAWFEKEQ